MRNGCGTIQDRVLFAINSFLPTYIPNPQKQLQSSKCRMECGTRVHDKPIMLFKGNSLTSRDLYILVPTFSRPINSSSQTPDPDSNQIKQKTKPVRSSLAFNN